jgi:hypothetical protein
MRTAEKKSTGTGLEQFSGAKLQSWATSFSNFQILCYTVHFSGCLGFKLPCQNCQCMLYIFGQAPIRAQFSFVLVAQGVQPVICQALWEKNISVFENVCSSNCLLNEHMGYFPDAKALYNDHLLKLQRLFNYIQFY